MQCILEVQKEGDIRPPGTVQNFEKTIPSTWDEASRVGKESRRMVEGHRNGVKDGIAFHWDEYGNKTGLIGRKRALTLTSDSFQGI